MSAEHVKECMMALDQQLAGIDPICTCTVENPTVLSVTDGIALWEKIRGKEWPEHSMFRNKLVHALMINIKTDITQPIAEKHVEDFLSFLGRLVSVMDLDTPSPGKAAAVLFLAERLNIQMAGPYELAVIVTLLDSAKVSSLLSVKNPAADA